MISLVGSYGSKKVAAESESDPIGQIIAERTLEVTSPDGRVDNLRIRLAAPVCSDGWEHRCYWEFVASGYREVRYAAGADGFQAIHHATRMIGVNLGCLAREKGYKLTFEGSEDIGFPDYND
jgi:hypothetical protein